MVDFQSRDTTRGLSSDDDDDEGEEEAEAEEAEAEAAEETEAEQTETEAEAGATDTDAGDGEAGEPDATTAEPAEGAATDTGEVDTAESPVGEAESDEPARETAAAGAAETASDPDESSHDHAETEDGHDHSHAHDDHDHSHAHDDSHDDHDHSHADHHHADVEQLGVAIVTVSSSRSLDDDPSGDTAQELVEEDGHSVVARDLVADDLDGVQRAVLALTGREDVDVVVTTGGTGVTPDDVPVEAIEPLFDKDLPGFGELFRILSYEEVGTRAMGSRATAGVSEGVPVFCLPGSEDAVRTGVDELILAEAPHLVGLANEDENEEED